MILSHPQGRWRGVVGATVRTTDLVPTVLSGLGLPAMQGIDGRDLTPLIEGGEHADREAYTEQLEWFSTRSLRRGEILLIQRGGSPEERAVLYRRLAPGRLEPWEGPEPPEVEELRRRLTERARGRGIGRSVEIDVSPEVAEQLRSLGYPE